MNNRKGNLIRHLSASIKNTQAVIAELEQDENTDESLLTSLNQSVELNQSTITELHRATKPLQVANIIKKYEKKINNLINGLPNGTTK